MMDDKFYKERARHIRELANEADPFIKKRLLRLARNYDAMTIPLGRTGPSDPPVASQGRSVENDDGNQG
jgi:hypothetical protein